MPGGQLLELVTLEVLHLVVGRADGQAVGPPVSLGRVARRRNLRVVGEGGLRRGRLDVDRLGRGVVEPLDGVALRAEVRERARLDLALVHALAERAAADLAAEVPDGGGDAVSSAHQPCT
jgi:hypothetical protein